MQNLAETLAAQEEPLKAALKELVRIPSVCEEGVGGYPFGPAIDQALHKDARSCRKPWVSEPIATRAGIMATLKSAQGAGNAGHPGSPGCRPSWETTGLGSRSFRS